jgi:hypothetical protein
VSEAGHDVNRDRELNILRHYCYYYSHNYSRSAREKLVLPGWGVLPGPGNCPKELRTGACALGNLPVPSPIGAAAGRVYPDGAKACAPWQWSQERNRSGLGMRGFLFV